MVELLLSLEGWIGCKVEKITHLGKSWSIILSRLSDEEVWGSVNKMIAGNKKNFKIFTEEMVYAEVNYKLLNASE